MFQVLSRSWALLIGMMLLMVGNGLQGTLLGVRGGIEGFSTFEMSIVMSAYFAGFLGGSRLAPEMIRRGGACTGLCSLGFLYLCHFDPLSSLRQSRGLGLRACCDRILLFWCVCHRGKLA